MFKTITTIGKLSLRMSTKLSLERCTAFLLKKQTYATSRSDRVYLIDEDNQRSNGESLGNVSKFTQRSHSCGELRISNVGETVTLCGWLQYQRMNKFVVLRDGYGETQIIVSDNDLESQRVIQSLPLETIIKVQGSVVSRPETMRNPKQPTGDVEVVLETLKVLNRAKSELPFNIREFQKAKEGLRMQYRYLDLRFPIMQRNLRVRSEMLMKMREFLVNQSGFVDVETPTLFKATPGGAQEFVVPTRVPGQFYSLVQSPQQFKQMLMAGAIDRYFQIARCYRDEGSRADRQPEFTQLDIEMSFSSREHITDLIENLLGYCWPEFLDPLPKTFPRLAFSDAMERYGSDKPDVRFDYQLQNCSDVFPSDVIQNERFAAYLLAFPKRYSKLSKKDKEEFAELSKQFPLVKLIVKKVDNGADFVEKLGKKIGQSAAIKLNARCSDADGLIFLAVGDKAQARSLLGKIRVDHVDNLESLGLNIRKPGMHFLWILDVPLFEEDPTQAALSSAHHPFTAPHPSDLNLLESAPLQVRSLAFDLVLNGAEIGGGSVRIHDADLQRKVFELLNIDVKFMRHIIDMLSSGCPPHGGIALGLDRLLSKILLTNSIRDVIAFPKNFEGRCPLSGAPSPISEENKRVYHIKTLNT